MRKGSLFWIHPLIIMGLTLILTNSCKKEEGTINDVDGNVYTSVTIGTQVWMVENLKTTKYNDGTAIPNVTDDTEWGNLTMSAYCWYDNDASTYKATYGALYNWYVVNTNKLCPTGWHVPSIDEWVELFEYLGGFDPAGAKMREAGCTHWWPPNEGATNESGFTGLPGGVRYKEESFHYSIALFGNWWSTTEYNSTSAWGISLSWQNPRVVTGGRSKEDGHSVRCVRD